MILIFKQINKCILNGWLRMKANGLAIAILFPRIDFGATSLKGKFALQSGVFIYLGSLYHFTVTAFLALPS